MAFCSTLCAVSLPTALNTFCVSESRAGGISRLLLLRCDVEIVDPLDKAYWCYLAKSNQVIMSSEILGQMPAATAVRKQTSSCRGEVTTGYDYSVTFQDYNADNTNFADYNYWNTLLYNYSSYQLGFITCDGLLLGYNRANRGFINNWSIDVSPIIEETINDSSYWEGSITWKGFTVDEPLKIDGLISVLSGDCVLDPYGPQPPTQDCTVGSFTVPFGGGITQWTIEGGATGDAIVALPLNAQCPNILTIPLVYPQLVFTGSDTLQTWLDRVALYYNANGFANTTVNMTSGGAVGELTFVMTPAQLATNGIDCSEGIQLCEYDTSSTLTINRTIPWTGCCPQADYPCAEASVLTDAFNTYLFPILATWPGALLPAGFDQTIFINFVNAAASPNIGFTPDGYLIIGGVTYKQKLQSFVMTFEGGVIYSVVMFFGHIDCGVEAIFLGFTIRNNGPILDALTCSVIPTWNAGLGRLECV